MAQAHIVPVILAGGVGSRFWPLSLKDRPKQLLKVLEDESMLEATLRRIAPLAPLSQTLIVSSERLEAPITSLLPDFPKERLLLEPSGKNTAPAIAWAARHALSEDPEAILMVLPSDHYIREPKAFQEALRTCVDAAKKDRLVTIGILPTRPETGYGYIRYHADKDKPLSPNQGHYPVEAFVEKPNLEKALAFLNSGNYLWNAGMFFMKASLFLEELAHYENALAKAIMAPPLEEIPQHWDALPSISVDYAVFERSKKVSVVPSAFGWSDIGSWPSLLEHKSKNDASFTRGQVLEIDGEGNVLFSDKGLIATLGVKDMIVVHTEGATLVCPSERAQEIKDLVHTLGIKFPDKT